MKILWTLSMRNRTLLFENLLIFSTVPISYRYNIAIKRNLEERIEFITLIRIYLYRQEIIQSSPWKIEHRHIPHIAIIIARSWYRFGRMNEAAWLIDYARVIWNRAITYSIARALDRLVPIALGSQFPGDFIVKLFVRRIWSRYCWNIRKARSIRTVITEL